MKPRITPAAPVRRLARLRRVSWPAALATVTWWVCAALGPASAFAALGIQPGSFQVTTTTDQAGAHPDLTTTFQLNTTTDPDTGRTVPDGSLKDVEVNLPPGLIGNAIGVPRCKDGDLQQDVCPLSAQVGVARTRIKFAPPSPIVITSRVYNVVPADGHPAEFGFTLLGQGVRIVASVRGDDYGVTTTIRNTPNAVEIYGTTLTLWGVPADSSHDADRGGQPAGVARAPLMTNPTQCGSELPATMRVSSWQQRDHFERAETTLPPVTGCDRLHFDAAISAQPVVTQAATPSGFVVDLRVKQNDDPDGLATANLKRAVVQLPDGVALSPAVAGGLGSCSDADLGAGTSDPSRCPASSKIGTATLATPLLPDQLVGGIYVGQPSSADPYRIFVVLAGDGVIVKLRGSVHADPQTGRLTTTFDENPQQPFSEFKLEFKGGSRAPLTMPSSCGTFTTTSRLTPWSALDGGADATPTDGFGLSWDGVGGACPATLPFAPGLSAGTSNPVAGGSTPFTFRLTRDDRNQDLGRIADVHLPAGLLADVSSVGRCSGDAVAAAAGKSGIAEQAGPSCPADSQIGTVQTGAGAGSSPLYLPGKVYLTGPYKGAPFGLAIVVPAVAGPFDLGTVVVRASVAFNNDGSLTVDSDSLPTILGGIPLRLRDIRLAIDKPGFMLNPTNCDPKEITADLQSVAGATAHLSNRFQVGDCAALPFNPQLAIQLTNKTQTKDGGHPGVRAVVTQARGEAGLKQVEVTLPLALALDPDNAVSSDLCEYQDGLHGNCPAKSIVGSATAITPILNQPLQGPVYFVKNVRFNKEGVAVRTLPTLLIQLTGENGIRIDLRASSGVDSQGRLVTTFHDVPDAPISGFVLNLKGGKKGILVVTHDQDLCKPAPVKDNVWTTNTPGQLRPADAALNAQSGKYVDKSITVRTPCSLAVFSRTYSPSKMMLQTGGFVGPGALKVSGTGIKTTKKTILGLQTDTATLSASLTATGKKMRKAGKTLKVRLSFTPKGAKAQVADYPKAKHPVKKKKSTKKVTEKS